MFLALTPPFSESAPIDRHALVSRHNVVLTAYDADRPLQVGNGEFAFGMDVTGLQTFAKFNTMSHWGWHSGPAPAGQKAADFKGQIWDTHGRPVRYPMTDPDRLDLSQWLASSPHRINLGRIGMALTKKDGSEASPSDLQNPKQTLDLWTGIVTSTFELEGEKVTVVTAGHPTQDTVAARIESPLIDQGRLAVFLAVPGNSPAQFSNYVGDWNRPGRLQPVGTATANRADFSRNIDEVTYYMGLRWQGNATLQVHKESNIPLQILKAEYGANDTWVDVTEVVAKAATNGKLQVFVGNNLAPDPINGVIKRLKVTYKAGDKTQTAEARENEDLFIEADPNRSRVLLKPTGKAISFTCTFSPKPLAKELPVTAGTVEASRASWAKFWKSGGALDLSGSADPRWKELERRVVLSQYLMAVNEAGSLPPQESGLVNNGWYGRFHMEMVWWHAAHWALWDRWPKVNPSFEIYKKILPQSKALAKSQGYLGARWPKCIGPDGIEWPHEIHAFLIWQQPHPIFFAELDYRAHPTKETLLKWQPIVDATADFMASYAFFDKEKKRYVLGPPLHVVSENVNPRDAVNPAFELGYWRFGLRVAQQWRERLGQKRNPKWDEVQKSLSPLPTENGLYVLHEGVKDMWTKWNFEHPALTGTFGMLPGDGVDKATMKRTLAKVNEVWDFNNIWGWDFPMLAMCAARLGETDRAMDLLLHSAERFQFDARGLATGGPFPYFPSNGGLLYAVGMMAAGWDGAPKRHAPGFPAKWKVKFEGIKPAL